MTLNGFQMNKIKKVDLLLGLPQALKHVDTTIADECKNESVCESLNLTIDKQKHTLILISIAN
jgi:hypothetical protein